MKITSGQYVLTVIKSITMVNPGTLIEVWIDGEMIATTLAGRLEIRKIEKIQENERLSIPLDINDISVVGEN